MDAQPLSHEATQRESAEMRTGDLQGIEQFEHVVTQAIDREGAARDTRRAVAAKIVAQDPERLGKPCDLWVPHVEVGSD